MTTLISFAVLADNTLNNLRAFGGSTESAIPGVPTVSSGYAVSLPGHEQQLNGLVGGRLLMAIADYAESKRAELAQPGRYLGAWLDEGVVYLDVTEVHAEFAQAVRLGYERNQLAIYDVARGEEVSTRPGRRSTLTDQQYNADRLAHENGWTSAWFKALNSAHGDIMSSVTNPSASPFESREVWEGAHKAAEAVAPMFEVTGTATYDAKTDTLTSGSSLVDTVDESGNWQS